MSGIPLKHEALHAAKACRLLEFVAAKAWVF
jgi:hypothetical protein